MTTPAEVIARSDADFDGRNFDKLSRVDRERYVRRASFGHGALAAAGYAIVPKEQVTWFRIDDPEHPAPRDGTRVHVSWIGGGVGEASSYEEDPEWYDNGRQCFPTPTHWRPLPAPPAPEE